MVGHIAVPMVAGAVTGGAALVPLSRIMTAYLVGVRPADPVSLSSAAAILLVVTLVAAYIPARRAAAVDPLVALRST
jgi:ABC-type antimicrobial peptide transport system permease subunit